MDRSASLLFILLSAATVAVLGARPAAWNSDVQALASERVASEFQAGAAAALATFSRAEIAMACSGEVGLAAPAPSLVALPPESDACRDAAGLALAPT